MFDWKAVEIVGVERKLYGAARGMVRCMSLNFLVMAVFLSDVLALSSSYQPEPAL